MRIDEMDIVEHRILEVIKVEEHSKYKNVLLVTVKIDCWGRIGVVKHITNKEDWERDLERGYYLA
jgi:hypothetical protein